MITPFFIVLLAFLLRIPLLSGSFWLDEAAQALESVRPLSEQLHIVDDFQPPLFHVIVHFFSLVSHQEWWLRMPSLVAGIATVLVLFILLKEKFGQQAATMGGLLLATSPFHIFYSQELRPYSLATFFAVLSWYILVSERVGKKKWVWFTLISILGMYTMYLYPFVILSQILYVWFENRQKMKTVVYSLGAVTLFFLPWLPTFSAQLRAGTALTVALPGWSLAVATPQLKALPLIFAKFFVGQVPFRGNPFFLFLTAIVLLLVFKELLTQVKNPKARLFFYWIGVPIACAWLVSFVIPIIQAKRMMLCLPSLLGILAVGQKRFSRMVVILVIVLQLFSLVWYGRDVSLQRENWRGVIEQIESQAQSNSVVLFSFPEHFAPWRWYETKKVPAITTGKLLIQSENDISSVSSQLESVSMVYLFDYLRDLTDPNHTIETMLVTKRFQEVDRIDGKQVGFVRIFKKL